MFIPESIRDVVVETVTRSAENDADVPNRDQMHSAEAYDETLNWVRDLPELPELDLVDPVEIHCAELKRGDYFRPVTPTGLDNTGDWGVFLDGEMTPNETWYFAMAYADPETGEFKGVHQEHDSNPVQVITNCRACESKQATVDGELLIDETLLTGPFCEDCYEEHETPQNHT